MVRVERDGRIRKAGHGHEKVRVVFLGQFQPLAAVVQPGQEVEVSVQFKAPDETGEYLSAWQMENPTGVTFPEIIFVKILVQ